MFSDGNDDTTTVTMTQRRGDADDDDDDKNEGSRRQRRRRRQRRQRRQRYGGDADDAGLRIHCVLSRRMTQKIKFRQRVVSYDKVMRMNLLSHPSMSSTRRNLRQSN
jgi:hypothetical protein